jgi:hypothetical protein
MNHARSTEIEENAEILKERKISSTKYFEH